ncbi:MAG: histidine phosphatase family protein [Streptosporangiaceae bacterium]
MTDVGVLLLVRHGQGSLGTSNYDKLSELGHRQSRLVGARLAHADLRVSQAWCGALARQRETARTVLAELGLPPAELHPDDRLDEYDHLGVLAADRAGDPLAADRAGDLQAADRTGDPPTADRTGDLLASDRAGDLLAADRAGDPFALAVTPESRLALQSALDEAIGRWIQGGADYPEPHSAFTARVEAVVAELTALPGTTMAVTSAGVIAVACARLTGLPADRWPALARVVVNTSVTRLITGRTGTHLLTFNDHAHLEGDRSLITYR